MRSTQSGQAGSQGQSEAAAAFESIGWGPIENRTHDLGTDYFVQVRDERLFDRGFLVGVQVKGGASFFRQPQSNDAGDLLGWWYREEGGDHFDYWVTHTIPHFLVLVDLDQHTCYWVRVTAESVQSTGRGNKILVPAAQRVERDQLAALLDAAASTGPAARLEGTAWTTGNTVAPGRRFRTALVAPRLIAPHPNAGYESAISAHQAVALITQARVTDLIEFSKRHNGVPDPRTATTSRAWEWRFVGALWKWAVDGDPGFLATAAADAPDVPRRVAACVANVCSMFEAEAYVDARDVLDERIRADDAPPADWAWLNAQRARVSLELGDLAGARTDALEATRAIAGSDDDVTASAIASAASRLLWQAFDWSTDTLRDLISASDTAVSWWRSQVISAGLTAAAERVFDAWAADDSIRLGAEDIAHNKLWSAAFTASFSGEGGIWHGISSVLAQHDIGVASSTQNVTSVAQALIEIRKSGNATAMKKAGRRVWEVGPLVAAAEAAVVRERSWTRSAARANFTCWSVLGDLLPESDASAAVDVCVAAVAGEFDTLLRLSPTFLVQVAAIEALSRLVYSASTGKTESVVNAVAALGPEVEPILEGNVAAIVEGLRGLGATERSLLDQVAHRSRSPRIAAAIFSRLASEGDESARLQLVRRARDGDLAALSELSDANVLTEGAANDLRSKWRPLVAGIVADARNNKWGWGGYDIVGALAVIDVHYPETADWSLLLDALFEPKVSAANKLHACRSLAAFGDRLPDEVASELAANLERIAQTPAIPELFQSPIELQAVVEQLGIVVGAYPAEQADARITRLLMGPPEHRTEAARALASGRFESLNPSLAALAADPSVAVRAAAGAAAAQRLSSGTSGKVERQVATQLANADGSRVPLAVLSGMRSEAAGDDGLQRISSDLQDHPSGVVRAAAASVKARLEPG